VSIKIYKVSPPPAPPPTFDITGLEQEQLAWLHSAVADRQRALRNALATDTREYEFMRRLGSLTAATNHEERPK
jgi:hypothetical protein